MMDPEIKEKWLTDLRSDKFKQGHGYLSRQFDGEDKERCCCLGVLAHIVVDAFPEKYEWKLDRYANSIRHHSNLGPLMVWEGSFRLSNAMLKNIGLETEEMKMCIQMNDRDRKSFEQIADYIERYF